MNKTFDEYWEEFISYLLKQCMRINPDFPENKQEFKDFLNAFWNLIKPFACFVIVIIAYLLVIPFIVLIAEYHIVDRIINYVISNGLFYTLLSLVVLFCAILILVNLEIIKTFGTCEKLKSFVKWERYQSFVKDNIVLFALLLLYIFFYHYWENLIGNHFIDKFLRHLNPNWFTDSIFVIGVIICFFISYHNRKKRINLKTILYCIIIIAFWVYYRCYQNICGLKTNSYLMSFKTLSFTDLIKYADILPIYAISTLISPLIGKLLDWIDGKKKDNHTDKRVRHFEKDVPIQSSKEDTLGRKDLAQNAMAMLLETNTDQEAFIFGINAPWGSGKTSFMRMMKEYISPNSEKIQIIEDNNKHDEITIIDFNPWLYSERKDLVAVFFDELSKNLKKYDRSLARNIIDYSKILSAFNTEETKLVASLIDLFHEDSTLLEKKRQIEVTLKHIKRKIFVFIDDLDRLDATEIMEMMKLIRNVSDFPYMYFVAAYDKDYLIERLNTIIKPDGATYINKIFQVELRLQEAPKMDLSNKLINMINVDPEEHLNWQEIEIPILRLLSNLRDVKRLANSFLLSYNSLQEVDTKDLLFIELIKMKYPTFYSYFMNHWVLLLTPGLESDSKPVAVINSFMNDVQMKMNELNLTSSDTNIIQEILYNIYGIGNNDSSETIDNGKRGLDKYFLSTKTDISTSDFSQLMAETSIETIKYRIDQMARSEYIKESLQHRLIEYQPSNKENYKKKLEVLLYATGIGITYTAAYQITDCIKKILYYHNQQELDDLNSDKSYIMDILIQYGKYERTWFYVYDIAFDAGKWDFPLTRKELNEVRSEILTQYLDNPSISARKAISCFYFTADREKNNGAKAESIYLHDNVNKLKMYMITHIIKTLPELIKCTEYDDLIIHYELKPIVDVIWGNKENFYNYVSSINDDQDPIVPQFKLLLESLRENDYNPTTIEDIDFNNCELKEQIHVTKKSIRDDDQDSLAGDSK